MSDYKLTDNYDLDMNATGKKDIQLLTDKKEIIKQRLMVRLKSYQNDWFLDLDNGIPYITDIFKKEVSLSAVQALLTSTILDTDGVDSLLSFEYDIDISTRSLSVEFTCKTEEGTLELVVDIL